MACFTMDWAYAIFWAAAEVVLATAVLWLWAGRWAQRAAALIVNCGTALGNVLLLLSVWLQGAGFNAQFRYHATWETLVLAADAVPTMLFGCILYLVLLGLWPILLRTRRLPSKTALAAAMCIGLSLNAPVTSLAYHGYAAFTAPKAYTLSSQAIEPMPLHSPRNLVLIYAEGLEATFGLTDMFGEDATPRLTALSRQGLRFTNMRQTDDISWTMAAMYASQCAVPLGGWTHRSVGLGGKPVIMRTYREGEAHGPACLGDILQAHGYHNAYMGGTLLQFAGTGDFLSQHGWMDQYGLQRLKPLLHDPAYVSTWGLHDDSLLHMALDKLAALDSDKPYALTVATMDTHGPYGFPSASCGPRNGEGLLFAMRCADRLLADFIGEVRKRHPDALVALLSDHLTNWVLLNRPRPPNEERRLRFTVWGNDVPAAEIDRIGTHYDIMPTLMDLMSLDAWAKHNLGASLLRYESLWHSNNQPPKLQVVHAHPTEDGPTGQ